MSGCVFYHLIRKWGCSSLYILLWGGGGSHGWRGGLNTHTPPIHLGKQWITLKHSCGNSSISTDRDSLLCRSITGEITPRELHIQIFITIYLKKMSQPIDLSLISSGHREHTENKLPIILLKFRQMGTSYSQFCPVCFIVLV